MRADSRNIGRTAWYLVDGLPLWIVDAALARAYAALPNLARLQRDGRMTGLHPLRPNCQTPPSLASLFGGTTAHHTGLVGFDLPTFEPDRFLGTRPAFRSLPDDVETIWDRAAAHGEAVRLSHVPFVQPGRLGRALASYSYGFNSVRHAPFSLGPTEAEAVLGGSVAGIGSVGWTPLSADEGTNSLATRRKIAGEERILFTGSWRVNVAGTSPLPDTIQSMAFMATGLQKQYRSGNLGPTLLQGGHGAAEHLFVESLRVMSHRYASEWLHHLESTESGLIVAYQPVLDLALHELAGFVAPDCAHWSEDRERIVWQLLVCLLSDLDHLLGRSLGLLRAGDRLIVTSDHGMSPIDTTVRPNVLLQRRGWLQTFDDGRIDAGRSCAFYHPAENGLLCLNRTALARAEIRPEQLLQTLVADIDALTRRRATTEAWLDLEPNLAPPDWLMARHFLSGGRFVQLLPDLAGPACAPSAKTGEHMVATSAPELIGTVLDLSPSGASLPREGLPTHLVAAYFEADRSVPLAMAGAAN